MNTDIYKTKLEEEKEVLTAQLSKLGVQDEKSGDWEADPQDIDPNPTDDNEKADRFEDFEERSATLNALEERFRQVEDALVRIADGSYGTCKKCGGPIEEARLNANVAADTCVKHM